jgi:hypothetical protein
MKTTKRHLSFSHALKGLDRAPKLKGWNGNLGYVPLLWGRTSNRRRHSSRYARSSRPVPSFLPLGTLCITAASSAGSTVTCYCTFFFAQTKCAFGTATGSWQTRIWTSFSFVRCSRGNRFIIYVPHKNEWRFQNHCHCLFAGVLQRSKSFHGIQPTMRFCHNSTVTVPATNPDVKCNKLAFRISYVKFTP